MKQAISHTTYYMYNIIQLSNKDLGELQEIANNMGIKGVKSLERQDLIYRILDEQAIAGAQKKVATEEGKNERRQRNRINKKEVANKVYSADKDKAEKVNDTPKIVATPINGQQTTAKTPDTTEALPVEEKQPEAKTEENATEQLTNTPKKRGRKPKAQKEAINKVRASEQESSSLELFQRTQPKLSEGNSQQATDHGLQQVAENMAVNQPEAKTEENAPEQQMQGGAKKRGRKAKNNGQQPTDNG